MIVNGLIVIFTFFFMEFVAWFAHKYIMHGFLWSLHKDHHQVDKDKTFQKNDYFFLIFAIPSIIFFVIGFIIFGCIRSAGDYFFTANNINYDLWKNFVTILKEIAELLLIISMTAVGFNTTLKKFKDLGIKSTTIEDWDGSKI